MREPIPIADPDDPRIADYRHIRERDLVGRHGRFIAEGEVVLRVLLGASLHRPLSLLLAENRVASLASVIERVPDDVPVYAAARPVMDRVAGFPMHRGILAIGERAAQPAAATLLGALRPTALILVLIGIANNDNMGGLFRNAAAFGAAAVLLDPTCCDPLYRKSIRVSVGAALTLPFARLAADVDFVALLAAHGFDAIALTPSAATPLSSLVRTPRMALILGSEGPGLPASLLSRTRRVAVPMAPGWDSLNVATASAIALYHLSLPHDMK